MGGNGQDAALPALGTPAPTFTLRDQHGAPVDLRDLSGAGAALLVFFPFAFSRVCTGELDGIRTDLQAYQRDGRQVAAISCDPMFTLRAWADQQGYAFPLLSDFWPHGQVARAYGVFDPERGMAGRGTFLIDREGVVRYAALGPVDQARDLAAALGSLPD